LQEQGTSLIWGGAAGMETLAGQAHGAGNARLLRLLLARALMVGGCD
jgi:Na+-driven multidrug efflux pump